MKSINAFLFCFFIFYTTQSMARKATPKCQPCISFYQKASEAMSNFEKVEPNSLEPRTTKSHIQIIKKMQKLFEQYIPQISPINSKEKANAIINTWLLVIDYNPVGDVANLSHIKSSIGEEGFQQLHIAIDQRIAIEKDFKKKRSLETLKNAMTYVEEN